LCVCACARARARARIISIYVRLLRTIFSEIIRNGRDKKRGKKEYLV